MVEKKEDEFLDKAPDPPTSLIDAELVKLVEGNAEEPSIFTRAGHRDELREEINLMLSELVKNRSMQRIELQVMLQRQTQILKRMLDLF